MIFIVFYQDRIGIPTISSLNICGAEHIREAQSASAHKHCCHWVPLWPNTVNINITEVSGEDLPHDVLMYICFYILLYKVKIPLHVITKRSIKSTLKNSKLVKFNSNEGFSYIYFFTCTTLQGEQAPRKLIKTMFTHLNSNLGLTLLCWETFFYLGGSLFNLWKLIESSDFVLNQDLSTYP